MVWFGQILLYLHFYHPIYMILGFEAYQRNDSSRSDLVNMVLCHLDCFNGRQHSSHHHCHA